MNPRCLPVLLLFIIWQSGSGQSAEPCALLWSISGKGLTYPSYLYGTMHSIEKKHFFLPSDFTTLFNQCRILATENASLLNRYISEETYDRINKHLYFLPRGKTLRDYLTPTQLDSVIAYMREVKISTSQQKKIFKLKPDYVSGAILSKRLGKRTGYELFFYRMAYNRNLSRTNPMIISNLEEYKYTLAVTDSISIESQAKTLMHDIATRHALHFKLVEAYKKQDITLLLQLVADSDLDLLVNTRNQNWIPKIEKLIHSQRTFIAVGAAHLAGERGLIYLLREQGYILEPVSDK